MNERLNELARQSGIAFLSSVPPDMLDKFAELIVGECANIAIKSGNIANKNIAAKIESERIYHKILDHFGVEE
jgi:hypothetical protein